MKQLLWLGSFMNEEMNQVMISQGYKNAASYVSQKNLLEGLEAVTGLVFDSINAVVMAGYPKQGGIIVKRYEYSHAYGARDVLVGYANPLYLNKLFMKHAMVNSARHWIDTRYTGGELDVFIYEMRSACLCAAQYIKTKIPQARVHLIIPDLPCFMDLNMSSLKRILKKIDWNQMIKQLDSVDDFFPYAETMVDYLDIRDRSWMVMEGSLNKQDIKKISFEVDKAKKHKTNKNIVMYSGWVDQSFGIDALVDAMEYLDSTYELWITGGGPYETKLKEKVANDSRVKYYGFLSTREALFELQAQASVMMNIRNPELQAAHYCFPSKLFEYMLLGVPVLSVKLRGVPEDYWKYLYELKNLDAKSIANAIKKIMEDNNRGDKARAGREFIETEKNNFAVAKRIVKFVEE